MLDLVNKVIYWFLSIQEKSLKFRLRNHLKRTYSKSTSKFVFSKGNTAHFSVQTEKNKQRLKTEAEVIIKKCGGDYAKLLKYISKNGTQVHKIPFANRVLAFINCEEGFIGEQRGINALFLSFVLMVLSKEKIRISIKTQPMFVMRDMPVDLYIMIQQFHKWYAMKLNLPGFDAESQENFQKFLDGANDSQIKDLSLDEIIGLKEAIARDVEAINFVVDLARATKGAQNAMKKLSDGGASV